MKVKQIFRYSNIKLDRTTFRQENRNIKRQINRKINRQINKETNRLIDLDGH